MSDTPVSAASSGYTLTVHVSNSFAGNGAIPHAFVTITGPGMAPVTVGYYPQVTGVSEAGTVRNDALSHRDEATREIGAHPYDQSRTFHITPVGISCWEVQTNKTFSLRTDTSAQDLLGILFRPQASLHLPSPVRARQYIRKA